MGAVRLLSAFELRRRWLSLVAVALMVVVVVGTVAAAVAGARRTSTSIARFRDWAHASDGNFQTNSTEEAASLRALLAARPEIDAVAERRLVNGFVEGRPISDIALVSDPEGRYGVNVDRPRLLAGRMPAANRGDEIVLNELAARLGRVRVGDVLHVKTWSEHDLEALFGNGGFPGFNGPRAALTVVGVVRTLDGLPGEVARTSPYAIASPAFLAHYRGVGAWPPAIFVRMRHSAAFAKLSEEMAATRLPDGNSTYSAGTAARTAYLDASQKAADSASWALLVFAVAAAVAGAIVIGQAVFRYLSGAASPEFLGQLGMTRPSIALAFTIPVLVATTIGSITGAVAAAVASPLLPIGLARRAEVDPGIRVDLLALLACVALVVAFVAVVAVVSVRRQSRSLHTEARLRRRGRTRVRSSAPPVVDMGVRFAIERNTGTRTVPVRAAFAALAVAVGGIAAAGVISTSYRRLADEPARWGWNWSSEPDYFGKQAVSTLEQRLVRDQRVAGVGELVTDGVAVNGVETSAWAMKSLKGNMQMTPRRGRLPRGPTEIALGEATLAKTNAHIGGRVRVAAQGGAPRSFTVVGTAVFRSQSETPVVDDGAAFTPAGFASVLKNSPDVLSSIELRYPPGADVQSLQTALTNDYDLQFNAFTVPQLPGVVRHLSETRSVAIALALFFATLGTLSLAHTLVVSTRRRRVQVAVLRTLGFRPAQVRATIIVQGTALALAAVALGLPVGIAVGRFLWQTLTNDLGALDAAATPWIIITLAIPITVLWAAALAAWPARQASRTPVANALHAE